jgi:hypothetical protein
MAVGVVGVHLQQVMTPNCDPPLSDENQDVAEDYEEPRPQDDGPSLPASSSSSSSFNKIFVQHPTLEDLISLVDDSLPFTTDSAGVSHEDIRLLDPTQQDGYRPRGDKHFPRASRARDVRHQPRRSPADEPKDRGCRRGGCAPSTHIVYLFNQGEAHFDKFPGAKVDPQVKASILTNARIHRRRISDTLVHSSQCKLRKQFKRTVKPTAAL